MTALDDFFDSNKVNEDWPAVGDHREISWWTDEGRPVQDLGTKASTRKYKLLEGAFGSDTIVLARVALKLKLLGQGPEIVEAYVDVLLRDAGLNPEEFE
jgi:hypothetical protein